MKDNILLIDGINFIYKGNIFFKSKDDTKPSFTIVYNFFRNLRTLIEEFNPIKIFFCLEGSNSFRKKIYSEYKSNRIIKNASENKIKAREDFNRQKDIILKLLNHLPITQCYSDTYEADDIIATLAENLKDENVIIVSNDKDFTQLLQGQHSSLKIFNPFKKVFLVSPEFHFLTFLCARGDSSDNVPSLMSERKAIELASDQNKLKEFLSKEENRSNYSLNKELVELKIINNEELIFNNYNINFDKLKYAFLEMEFQSMIEEKYWERFVKTFERLH